MYIIRRTFRSGHTCELRFGSDDWLQVCYTLAKWQSNGFCEWWERSKFARDVRVFLDYVEQARTRFSLLYEHREG